MSLGVIVFEGRVVVDNTSYRAGGSISVVRGELAALIENGR